MPRRLKNMGPGRAGKTANGRAMMDNIYEYDKVNNILSLKNVAPIPTSNLMGGASEYHYQYDDLYRLTEAQGSYRGTNHEHRYALSMQYNTVGGIENKTQTHDRKSSGQNEWVKQGKTTYELAYAYGTEQPNALCTSATRRIRMMPTATKRGGCMINQANAGRSSGIACPAGLRERKPHPHYL